MNRNYTTRNVFDRNNYKNGYSSNTSYIDKNK